MFSLEMSLATLLKLTSFLFWSLLYFWCKVKFPSKTPEFGSRAVTLLHGTVATIVGLVQCDVGSLSVCRFTSPVLTQHYALMVWSWGYFAFDLLWCLLYWTESALILVHHFCALTAITFYMYKEGTGCTFPCTLALMEITNPLLQTRWFLRDLGLEKTKIFLVIELSYLVSFFFCRGVVGSYLLFKIMTSDVFGYDQKTIGIALYLISVGLMWEILSFVLYKYRNNIGKFKCFLDEMGIILDEQI